MTNLASNSCAKTNAIRSDGIEGGFWTEIWRGYSLADAQVIKSDAARKTDWAIVLSKYRRRRLGILLNWNCFKYTTRSVPLARNSFEPCGSSDPEKPKRTTRLPIPIKLTTYNIHNHQLLTRIDLTWLKVRGEWPTSPRTMTKTRSELLTRGYNQLTHNSTGAITINGIELAQATIPKNDRAHKNMRIQSTNSFRFIPNFWA